MKNETSKKVVKRGSKIFRRKEDRKVISDSLRAMADRVDRSRSVVVDKFSMKFDVKKLPSPGKWQQYDAGENLTIEIAIVCRGFRPIKKVTQCAKS